MTAEEEQTNTESAWEKTSHLLGLFLVRSWKVMFWVFSGAAIVSQIPPEAYDAAKGVNSDTVRGITFAVSSVIIPVSVTMLLLASLNFVLDAFIRKKTSPQLLMLCDQFFLLLMIGFLLGRQSADLKQAEKDALHPQSMTCTASPVGALEGKQQENPP